MMRATFTIVAISAAGLAIGGSWRADATPFAPRWEIDLNLKLVQQAEPRDESPALGDDDEEALPPVSGNEDEQSNSDDDFAHRASPEPPLVQPGCIFDHKPLELLV